MMPIFLINSSHYARTGESKAMHTRRETDMNFRDCPSFGLLPCFICLENYLVVIPLYA
jgi:adenosylcobinamide-GDP ribazoletransferase